MELIRVEVIGELPIVSVVGHRDETEQQFGADGAPLFDDQGNPVVTTIRIPVTEDVSRGRFAHLDPAQTNVRALVRAGLVRVAPQTKKRGAA